MKSEIFVDGKKIEQEEAWRLILLSLARHVTGVRVLNQLNEFLETDLIRYAVLYPTATPYDPQEVDILKKEVSGIIREQRIAKLKEILCPERPFYGDPKLYEEWLDDLIFSTVEDEDRKERYAKHILRIYQEQQIPAGLRFLYPNGIKPDDKGFLEWKETLQSALERDKADFAKCGYMPDQAGLRIKALLSMSENERNNALRGKSTIGSTSYLGFEPCPFPNCPHHDPFEHRYAFADLRIYINGLPNTATANLSLSCWAILWHMLSDHGLSRTKGGRIDPETLIKLIF